MTYSSSPIRFNNTSSTGSSLDCLREAMDKMVDRFRRAFRPMLRVSQWVPSRSMRNDFPHERFVEHEQSDTRWGDPLGMCTATIDDGPCVYRIDWSEFSDWMPMPGLPKEAEYFIHPDNVEWFLSIVANRPEIEEHLDLTEVHKYLEEQQNA